MWSSFRKLIASFTVLVVVRLGPRNKVPHVGVEGSMCRDDIFRFLIPIGHSLVWMR